MKNTKKLRFNFKNWLEILQLKICQVFRKFKTKFTQRIKQTSKSISSFSKKKKNTQNFEILSKFSSENFQKF